MGPPPDKCPGCGMEMTYAIEVGVKRYYTPRRCDNKNCTHIYMTYWHTMEIKCGMVTIQKFREFLGSMDLDEQL